MTPLKLPRSAFAIIVAACGGNVAVENSNADQLGTPSNGGAPNGSTTAPVDLCYLGMQGGLVELTPDMWAQLNDPACTGSTTDISPWQEIPDDASIPMQGVFCGYPLTVPGGQVPDPNRTNLVYAHGDPPSIRYLIRPSDGNCTNGDGWYVSADGFQFVLCAKTCATVQQDPTAAIELHLSCGCGPIILN